MKAAVSLAALGSFQAAAGSKIWPEALGSFEVHEQRADKYGLPVTFGYGLNASTYFEAVQAADFATDKWLTGAPAGFLQNENTRSLFGALKAGRGGQAGLAAGAASTESLCTLLPEFGVAAESLVEPSSAGASIACPCKPSKLYLFAPGQQAQLSNPALSLAESVYLAQLTGSLSLQQGGVGEDATLTAGQLAPLPYGSHAVTAAGSAAGEPVLSLEVTCTPKGATELGLQSTPARRIKPLSYLPIKRKEGGKDAGKEALNRRDCPDTQLNAQAWQPVLPADAVSATPLMPAWLSKVAGYLAEPVDAAAALERSWSLSGVLDSVLGKLKASLLRQEADGIAILHAVQHLAALEAQCQEQGMEAVAAAVQKQSSAEMAAAVKGLCKSVKGKARTTLAALYLELAGELAEKADKLAAGETVETSEAKPASSVQLSMQSPLQDLLTSQRYSSDWTSGSWREAATSQDVQRQASNGMFLCSKTLGYIPAVRDAGGVEGGARTTMQDAYKMAWQAQALLEDAVAAAPGDVQASFLLTHTYDTLAVFLGGQAWEEGQCGQNKAKSASAGAAAGGKPVNPKRAFAAVDLYNRALSYLERTAGDMQKEAASKGKAAVGGGLCKLVAGLLGKGAQSGAYAIPAGGAAPVRQAAAEEGAVKLAAAAAGEEGMLLCKLVDVEVKVAQLPSICDQKDGLYCDLAEALHLQGCLAQTVHSGAGAAAGAANRAVHMKQQTAQLSEMSGALAELLSLPGVATAMASLDASVAAGVDSKDLLKGLSGRDAMALAEMLKQKEQEQAAAAAAAGAEASTAGAAAGSQKADAASSLKSLLQKAREKTEAEAAALADEDDEAAAKRTSTTPRERLTPDDLCGRPDLAEYNATLLSNNSYYKNSDPSLLYVSPQNMWLEKVHDDPPLILVHNFLSPEECDHIIMLACGRLARSTVATSTGSAVDRVRTSATHFFDMSETEVLRRVEDRAVLVTQHPRANLESLQIVRYQPGQQYVPHYDWFDDWLGAGSFQQEMLRYGGQRASTLFVYMSEAPWDASGGTSFPFLNLTVRPPRGTGVLFLDTHPNGTVDRRTYHGGTPPKKSTKYGLNVWVRQRSRHIDIIDDRDLTPEHLKNPTPLPTLKKYMGVDQRQHVLDGDSMNIIEQNPLQETEISSDGVITVGRDMDVTGTVVEEI